MKKEQFCAILESALLKYDNVPDIVIREHFNGIVDVTVVDYGIKLCIYLKNG